MRRIVSWIFSPLCGTMAVPHCRHWCGAARYAARSAATSAAVLRPRRPVADRPCCMLSVYQQAARLSSGRRNLSKVHFARFSLLTNAHPALYDRHVEGKSKGMSISLHFDYLQTAPGSPNGRARVSYARRAGSSPARGTCWCSSIGQQRLFRKEEVVGSSPTTSSMALRGGQVIGAGMTPAAH